MLRRLFFFLFLIFILSFLVFNIFKRLGEQSKVFQKPQKYFPGDPILFVEVDEFSKTFHHFFETSMIWSKFEEVAKNNQYGNLIKEINSLIRDSNYNEIFLDGLTNISFYNENNNISWIIAKNFLEKEDKRNNLDSNFIKSYFFDISYPFLIISNSKSLINEFNSNYKSSEELEKTNDFSDKMKFSSEMSNISGFINIDNFKFFLDSTSDRYKSHNFFSELNTNKWFQFDINYSPNDIKIVGITDFDTAISRPVPEYYGFKNWIPEDVDFISKNIFHIQTDSLKNHLVFKSLELKFQDLIQDKEHEILVLESQSENLGFNKLSKLFLSDSLKFSKSENNFSVIDSNLLKLYFPHLTFRNRYGFKIDQFLLIASLEAKKEFDYQLSQISSDNFNTVIFSENKNPEFDQEYSHFSYKSQLELVKKNALSENDFDNTINNIFKSIGGISWGINNYNNRAYHGVSIKKFYPKKVDKNILWKVKIPKLIWGPYALTNHRSGTKDIIVQDEENTIYLISAGGKVKWSKNLEGKILGGVSQIDTYKNNKFQMVFNTKFKLHIIDILGNEIDGFPIKFNYLASNPVSIFDYDHSKDYRFLIAGEDFKIYNYNISGIKVSGWLQPELTSSIDRQLKHFAINGLDYILSIQNSGVIKLYNRRGGERFSVKNKVFLASESNFSIDKSFIIDSTSIVFEDSLGGISKLVLGKSCKEIYSISDSLKRNENYWHIFANNKFNKVNYFLKQKEKLKIIDQNEETFDFQFYYQFDVLHGKRFDNFMAILNIKTNEIQLIDSKYNINPNLFRASKMSCIENINNDNSEELITVVNKNILICYQIPSLN
ncbi:MAG: hypothetical protein CL841_08795 [Crocinitomicaceae bacterium]|nr:hypothetical protein [Crocinitomicaceae bacterium]